MKLQILKVERIQYDSQAEYYGTEHDFNDQHAQFFKFWCFFLVPIYINHCLDWKRSSGWLESQEGLLFVTDVSTTCVEARCQNISHKQQSFSGLQSPGWSFSIKVCYSWVQTIFLSIIAFHRTHTIYVVFQSRGFYDVPQVLWCPAGFDHGC